MRWGLAWIGCALALAAVACEDEPTPPASTPEPRPAVTATATSSPAPASAATPERTSTRTAAPSPSASPDPTPEPTPMSTPEPTPPPPSIEPTVLTRGEPRPLPVGVALYYWVAPCVGCGAVPFDVRRVVFDEAVGALREDRPLAPFDAVNDIPNYYPVRSFRVSRSGQTMAATICHEAYCDVDPWEDPEYPSIDSELRLWVSGDGGGTWEDWGQLLPETWIIGVTDDDVLVRTRNIWGARWEWLTDDEWEQMLAELVPLGLDDRTGWSYRHHWVASGERVVAPVLRNGDARDGPPLAIEEDDGSVRHVAREQLEGPFRENDLFIRPSVVYHHNSHLAQIATADLVDLTTRSIHEVAGLALPLGYEPEAGQQQEFYIFFDARPASAAE